MANAYGNTTKLFSTPYLTVAEYKAAPTAIDYNNLVVDSSDPAAQDAELANNIARASSWIDAHCNQVLAATVETEQQRVRVSGEGYLKVHPKYSPIVAVTSMSYGSTPNNLTTYNDCSQAWVEEQSIIFPSATGAFTSSAGQLSFGANTSPRSTAYIQYNYVSGYANTTLSAATSAGATSITVADGTGIVAGSRLTVFDGLATETFTVKSTYTFGSTTVPVDGTLVFAHTSGVAVSALPPAVKEAAILATTAFLKVRGDYSMTMQVTSQVGTASPNMGSLNSDLDLAKELLIPFRRIR
jgi:hypothetical protein